MKKVISVLLAFSMLLAMIILPVTAEGVEDISATVHFAEQWQGYSDALAIQDKGVLTNNLSATNGTKFMLHSDAPFTYKRMMCSCADGINCAVLAAVKAADVHIKYTKNAGMLSITFADEVKSWDGADHNCVYATAIPTAQATAGAVVEGVMWYEQEGHKTDEFPFAFTLVEAPSHVVHTDISFANNFGSGVLPAMNVQLAAGKTMSVAMCTTWWTEGQYTATPVTLTPEFTQGEGLVTLNLANAAYPEIWDSAACTYLNIVPTEAGRAITEDTVVTGSCTIMNRNGVAVPLQFSITLLSSRDFQEWGIADAWTAMAERMLAMTKPTPITHTFSVNGETEGFKTILHSSWHFTKCICGAENCAQMGNIDNLKSRVDVGADLVNLSFEKVYNEAWAQDCTYITLTLTEAAKQTSGTFPVQGVFYYESEDGIHKSAEYAFDFKLQVEVQEEEETTGPSEEPEVTPPEILTDMPYQASAAIEAMIGGDVVTPITAVIRADANYRGLLFRTAMLPYIPCENDGNNCAGIAGMGLENLKVVAQTNSELVEFSTEIAAYDDGWGDCFYLYVTPTEAAKAAEDGTQITGLIYLENESHKTVGIPFVFVLGGAVEEPPQQEDESDLTILSQMPFQASDAVQALIDGAEVKPIEAQISADAKYRGLLVRTAMLPYISCKNDGGGCSHITACNAENLKFNVKTNSELVEFSAKIAAFDGDGWGKCFYVYLTPTEAAKSAAIGSVISGEIYFENNGHKTVGIPFRFTLEKAENIKPEPIRMESFPYQVSTIIDVQRTGGDITPVNEVVKYGNSYRGIIMRTAMLPFLPCVADGVACQDLKNCSIGNLVINVKSNGHLMDFDVELAQYDGGDWGKCFYLYATPTEAAKNVAAGTAVTGELYFETGNHKSRPIPFIFFLEEKDDSQISNISVAPPVEAPKGTASGVKLDQLPFQVDSVINTQREGQSTAPILINVDPQNDYIGLLMTKAMLPFLPCSAHGKDCSEMQSLTPDHLKSVIGANDDLVSKLWFEVADYDGWGESIYLHIEFTEKAMQAAPGTQIPVELYFAANGATTLPINLIFNIAAANESGDVKLDQLPFQVDGVINAMREGQSVEPIQIVVDPQNNYMGLLMTKAMLPFVPCNVHGKDCAELQSLTPDHLKSVIGANEDLVSKLWFEVADYDGWGESIYLHIEFTEKAMQAAQGTMIPVELFFEDNGIRTVSIALEFFIGAVSDNPNEEEPTDSTDNTVDQPEQAVQVVPRIAVAKNNTLLVVLAVMSGVLLVALIAVIVLISKKKK